MAMTEQCGLVNILSPRVVYGEWRMASGELRVPALPYSPFAIRHSRSYPYARTVLVFVHFAGRMDDEGARHHGDGLPRRAHGAAAFEAEIDLGGVGVAMIGADLARFPAGHRDVAVLDGAEDFFDVFFRVELGLAGDAENMHCRSPWPLSSRMAGLL